MNVDKPTLRRNRIKLVMLALLFFGPILVAWVLLMSGWRPAGMVNNGELIRPPVALEPANLRADGVALVPEDLRGRWTLLLILDGPCREQCFELLEQTARVHVALHRNMDRVQRALVLADADDAPTTAGALVLTAERRHLAEWSGGAGVAVQLVDPAGYRMMHYEAPLDAHGLLKDLERLLRVSRRDGEQRRLAEPS